MKCFNRVKLLTWFNHKKTPCETCHQAKKRCYNDLLPGEWRYTKSQWWQLSSGVWHFELLCCQHLKLPRKYKTVWKLPQSNNRITDLTNIVIAWRLKVNLFCNSPHVNIDCMEFWLISRRNQVPCLQTELTAVTSLITSRHVISEEIRMSLRQTAIKDLHPLQS